MWRSLVARSAGGGEVISSNLVTPTKTQNSETLRNQPFIWLYTKVSDVSKNFYTTIIQHQYKPFTTLLQLKSGDLVATKTDDPLDNRRNKIL